MYISLAALLLLCSSDGAEILDRHLLGFVHETIGK